MGLESHLEAIGAVLGRNPDPVVVVGQDGGVLYANLAALHRWPEGDPKADPTSSFGGVLSSIRELGEPARVEWGEMSPAGVKSWFSCAVSPIHARQQSAGAWLCISTEVTELKRNEERLSRAEKLMVDTQGVAHLGTWEWNVNEPNAFWSDELYRIYGLTRGSYTPSYEAYLTMVHPEDRRRVIDATNLAFHEHVPYSHDERIFRPDGSIRHLHTWAYPILDGDGKLRRLVGVCQDITERKEAEAQVRQMNADLERRVAERTGQLERSMRALESFNAMVSHDLRSPLNTIVLSLSAMEPNRPEVLVRAKDRITRAVKQMTTLIDDLLAFASIGDAPLQCAHVDLSAMAREIVSDLQQSSPARTVHVDIEDGISCFADAGLMRIALQNVLGNAWKYTSRTAAPFIGVATTSAPSEDGRRVLVVRDNGAGFDMKDVARLFVPFQRLHTDGEFSGTGVGLASVQRVLERHCARVWAEAAPGQGATFFIELPRGE